MATKDEQVVTIDGHRLTLTNLDKVLYPETGTTKGDVLSYYAAVADHLLPHVRNRPVTRKRWVHGVGTAEHPGEVFFQKNLDAGTPRWVARRSIEHRTSSNEYPLLNDLATLMWLAQIAALEIHVPQWQFGRTGERRNPDRLVLDLDPGEGAGLAECVDVARLARSILTDMGLDPMPVTSGSKGIHLYAAIDGSLTSDEVSAVAHELARALEADHPDLVVSDMKKTLRTGKVLVDWSQNNGNKTTIAPYSLRGRSRPTVALPRTWRELESPELRHLEYSEVMDRMERDADPLAGLTAGHLASPEPTPSHSDAVEAAPATRDRLAKYRSMRDKTKTSEPVPDEAPPTTEGRSFVVQEHHARRLHYDFRLEHDGVLVSWAVPKGLPTSTTENHLAVQTEDHPLEYGEFEGTIPHGEYGAGEVTIWEYGDYEEEKWREGKEVIVTLHGRKGEAGMGDPKRYALIHTGGNGRAANNWLMHLMDGTAPKVRAASGSMKRATATPSTGRSATRDARGTLAPMLATAGTPADLPDVENWAFEMKWDGIRALAFVEDGDVRLLSRNTNDLTRTYPELQELVDVVGARSAVLDGEIVALAGGRPDFGRLQERMNLTKAADVQRARSRVPVHFLLFDALEIGGESLLGRTYDERRAALLDIVTDRRNGVVQVPPAFDGALADAIDSSRALNLEGVLAKRRDSTYSGGVRSRAWVKIKHSLHQEVVIGGWRPGKGRRANGVGSLLLAVPDSDGLRYVGRVGTGFRDSELDAIARRLAPLERKTNPMIDVPRLDASDAHWVRPTLVGEVEFAEWTSTRRLRQPSWRGWRPDKAPEDVTAPEL
ncbi:ATP-dependent DNA ligase [Planctomonas psychrotolerans]|uniref:ATP-dependent DNA ligase n=1 Tax=Planctomonas psychrotolerans TaxID=2528712 RepID=UPI0012387F14|nr:ATP-dependent DNA ligase [Planctomonas psychrotolerans]